MQLNSQLAPRLIEFPLVLVNSLPQFSHTISFWRRLGLLKTVDTNSLCSFLIQNLMLALERHSQFEDKWSGAFMVSSTFFLLWHSSSAKFMFYSPIQHRHNFLLCCVCACAFSNVFSQCHSLQFRDSVDCQQQAQSWKRSNMMRKLLFISISIQIRQRQNIYIFVVINGSYVLVPNWLSPECPGKTRLHCTHRRMLESTSGPFAQHAMVSRQMVPQLFLVTVLFATQRAREFWFTSVGYLMTLQTTDVRKSSVTHLTHVSVNPLVCLSLVSLQAALLTVALFTQVTMVVFCRPVFVLIVDVSL